MTWSPRPMPTSCAPASPTGPSTAIGSGVVAGVAAPFILGSEPAAGGDGAGVRPAPPAGQPGTGADLHRVAAGRRRAWRERSGSSRSSGWPRRCRRRCSPSSSRRWTAGASPASPSPARPGCRSGATGTTSPCCRTATILLSVGDVTGRGPVAAGVMGLVRAAVRALALSDPDPASILEHTDDLLRGSTVHQLATAWVGLLDPDTGQLRFASAGHVPPLVLGPDGRRFLDDTPGLLLGTGLPGTRRSSVHDDRARRLDRRLHRRVVRATRRVARGRAEAHGRRPRRRDRPRRGQGRPAARRPADRRRHRDRRRHPAAARGAHPPDGRRRHAEAAASQPATAAATSASAPLRSWRPPSIQWWVTGAGIVPVHSLELRGRAERVAGPVDEQARHADLGQVVHAEVVRLARRVQRVRDQRPRRRSQPGTGSPSAPAATIEHIRPPIDRPPTTTRSAAIAASSSRTVASSFGVRSGARRPSRR